MNRPAFSPSDTTKGFSPADTKVLLAVALPPPLHGQSTVNAHVLQELISKSVPAHVGNIAPDTSRGKSTYHLSRIYRVAACAWAMWRRTCKDFRSGYFVYESGLGILYNFVLMGSARLLGLPIFLHHHTSRHCLVFSRRFNILARLAGNEAVHIVLSPRMGADLTRLYPVVGNCLICGNAAVVPVAASSAHDQDVEESSHRSGFVLGMLSNLTAAKGAVVALESLEVLLERGLEVDLILAGPIMDPQVERALANLPAKVRSHVHAIGAVSGEEKARFFSDIDLFIFPSKYKFEAQPLVVLEALSHAVPCIATNQGFTSEIIDRDDWIADSPDEFVDKTYFLLTSWLENEQSRARDSGWARQRFQSLRAQANGSFDRLIDELTGAAAQPL